MTSRTERLTQVAEFVSGDAACARPAQRPALRAQCTPRRRAAPVQVRDDLAPGRDGVLSSSAVRHA
jgi:hypothetical protein